MNYLLGKTQLVNIVQIFFVITLDAESEVFVYIVMYLIISSSADDFRKTVCKK